MSSQYSYPKLWMGGVCIAIYVKTKMQSAVNDSIGSMGEIVVQKQWNKLGKATIDFCIIAVQAALGIFFYFLFFYFVIMCCAVSVSVCVCVCTILFVLIFI